MFQKQKKMNNDWKQVRYFKFGLGVVLCWLTHMQAFPLISGSDTCHGSRNGGESLGSRRNETELPQPQTLLRDTTRHCWHLQRHMYIKGLWKFRTVFLLFLRPWATNISQRNQCRLNYLGAAVWQFSLRAGYGATSPNIMSLCTNYAFDNQM